MRAVFAAARDLLSSLRMTGVGVRSRALWVSLLLVAGCGSAEQASTCSGSADPLTVATGNDEKLARGLAMNATHAYWTTGQDVADCSAVRGLADACRARGSGRRRCSCPVHGRRVTISGRCAQRLLDCRLRSIELMRRAAWRRRPRHGFTTTGQAQALAIDATSAYWLTFHFSTQTSAVMKAPLGGGAGVELAVAQTSQGSLVVESPRPVSEIVRTAAAP